jgi:sensor domain CHASE-containing protein
VVVPIGVIVAVAIVCIVVAVLSSAQRADVVAVDHEKQLFSRAITNYGERVLREVESVASSEGAIQNIRRVFDPAWARQRVGIWLETYFDHDHIFIFDRRDELAFSMVGHKPAEMKWFEDARPGLISVIDYMRGRDPDLRDAFRLNQATVANGNAHLQIAAIRRLMGRPAVIAAVAVGPADGVHASPDSVAPVIMSVKFIDEGALARIATQLRLTNLRRIEQDPIPTGDLAFATPLCALPGLRNSPAPRSCTTWCRSSLSRSPASRCLPLSSCVTCAAPPRRLRPANRGCVISPCTIRSAAFPTASSSVNGWKR